MPKKTAFIFPGTCVKLGMGESLFGEHSEAASLLEKAEAVTGRPLGRLMRTGPLEELQRPLNSLPATFVLSLSVFDVLLAAGLRPAVVLGRSLGDLTAAVAAGALTVEAGLELVKLRGELFDAACARLDGRMAVVLNLAPEETLALCREAQRATGGVCELASINTASNCVITGQAASVDKALDLAREKRAIVIPLPLPWPSHSSLMMAAEEECLKAMAGLAFADTRFPFLSEPAGGPTAAGREVFRHLAETGGKCVNWARRVGLLKNAGVERFLELGSNQGMAVIAAKLLGGGSGRNIETSADIRSLSAPT